MMDVQGMMDAMSASWRRNRSQYHVTLGKLIAILEGIDADGHVRLDDSDLAPGRENSYRGYYEDLAFEPVVEPVTVADFLSRCRAALGSTYEGYKGGDYTMDADTPLWLAGYGDCGPAIVDAVPDNHGLKLITKEIDD